MSHRHPLLSRIAATAGVLLALSVLAVLWIIRPPLPHIPSLTGPLTGSAIRDGLLCLAWLLAVYLALAVLLRAARLLLRGPAWQREAILPGVIPKPPPPRPAVPLTERFQPLFAPRPDPGAVPDATAPAVGQADTPIRTSPTRPTRRQLSICLLGPLKIEGTKRPFTRLPTRELIAYLALHPHGAGREELTEAIWPGKDPKRTLPRFYQLVTDARHALGDTWVREGERYRLDRETAEIDIDQLNQLLAEVNPDREDEQQQLQAALELWRGQPLEGADYAWAEGHIRNLSATYISLLERAGHARLQHRDARGALQAAEQGLAIDALNESLWRLAMQAESQLGLRESIGQRYEQLARTLDEQVGLQPDSQTRALYRQLLGQR